jgi:hypothetical protein
MPMFRLFNLGLNQKHFGGNNQIANVSINLGSTKGRGSSTRMFNYCNQRSSNHLECINQFISIAPTIAPTITSIQSIPSIPSIPPPPVNYHWSALGSGTNSNSATSFAVAVDSTNNVYVGGYFSNAGGISANSIAKWNPNTSTWSTLTSGVSNYINSIAIDSTNNVYVGGRFTNAGGISANNVAKWNPNTNTWSALGSGITFAGGPLAISVAIDSNNNVYVGGFFSTAGGISANNIAKWNPNTSTWSPLGSGTNNIVTAIAIDSNDNVYVGGSFTSAGGIAANYVAKWNQNISTWSALDSGVNNNVRALAVDSNDNVYVGGGFTYAGDSYVGCIAKWNPNTSNWSSLGSGVTQSKTQSVSVSSIAIDSVDNVYIGGLFEGVNSSIIANNIAKWNPNTSTWSELDGGTNYSIDNNIGVASIDIDSNNNVYIAGGFTTAGTISANYVAKWGV